MKTLSMLLWARAPVLVTRPLLFVISACGPADPVEVHERLVESAVAFLRSQNPRLDGVTKEDLFEAIQ